MNSQPYLHGMRYHGRVPRTPRKPGYVLVHNRIMHTKDMPSGVNGFRFWTQKGDRDVVLCKCGWQDVLHYRFKGENARCEPGTWQELEARMG
jgi:hypothetical protein